MIPPTTVRGLLGHFTRREDLSVVCKNISPLFV